VPPLADGSAPDVAHTVTVAGNGASVLLRTGQRLRVLLAGHGPHEQWDPPVSSGTALRRISAVGGYPTGQPADAVFLATEAGTALVSAITDFACLHATPPCKLPQRGWSVQVVVTSSP
jgi:hypothetical protein